MPIPSSDRLLAALNARPQLILPSAAQTLLSPVMRAGSELRPGLLSRIPQMIGRFMGDSAEIDAQGGRDPQWCVLPRWARDRGAEIDECGLYAIVDGVALMTVEGALYDKGWCSEWSDYCCWGYDLLTEAYQRIAADDRAKALFIKGDSPGGMVDCCPDSADELKALAAQKPVHVHAQMACSAFYWHAAQASRITGPREGLFGSIGVVLLHISAAGALKEWGLEVTPIQFGDRKTDGAWFKALDEGAKERLQSDVDEIGEQFVATVAPGRDLDPKAILTLQADAFMAKHSDPKRSALSLGLVDEITTEPKAFEALLESISQPARMKRSGKPSDAGASAARRSKPAPAATGDTDMPLKDQVAALRARAAAGDKAAIRELNANGIPVSAPPAKGGKKAGKRAEDDEQKEEEEEPDPDAEEDDEADPDAEEDDEADPDAEEEEEETDAEAVTNHPEAKGREGLAASLAGKVAAKKLSKKDAIGLLKAAPKASGSRLAGADPRMPRGGAVAGEKDAWGPGVFKAAGVKTKKEA